MTKSISVRRREQRDRQKAYRDDMRALKKPERDDIARVWLWRTLRACITAPDPDAAFDPILDAILDTLEFQGFDRQQSELAIDDLINRYKRSSSPPFRRKCHLR